MILLENEILVRVALELRGAPVQSSIDWEKKNGRIRSQVPNGCMRTIYFVKRVNNFLLESAIQRMNLHGNSQVNIGIKGKVGN